MSMYEETRPIELLGGPWDGLSLDVAESCDEVRRLTARGDTAAYAVDGRYARFVGLVATDARTLGDA